MKPCPKGAIVNHSDLFQFALAIDYAIDGLRALLNAEMVHGMKRQPPMVRRLKAQLKRFDGIQRRLPPIAGRCRYCFCSDDRACLLSNIGGEEQGCSWIDESRTVCSRPSCVAKARKRGKAAA